MAAGARSLWTGVRDMGSPGRLAGEGVGGRWASMRVVTWNVNSIKARRERALRLLERLSPDVLCLQELKVTDDAFDREAFEAAGYHAAVHGQKTYNGVAILARTPPEDVAVGLDDGVDDPQARLIAATIDGLRVLSAYFPNGGEVGSDKFAYKLAWMRRLAAHLSDRFSPGDPVVLAGDFNVAVDETDVAFPDRWADSVLCHPDARAALERVRGALGLVDLFRAHHPEGGIYSWWDYRQLAFPKGDGLRIDHVYGTAALASGVTEAFVDRDERKGKQPSDHAPVVVDLDR